jgi:subtilisin family serine protease
VIIPTAPRRAGLAWALLLLGMLGAAAAAAATSSPTIPTGDESREILVMLRLTPDHFRPNASYGGDYGDGQTSVVRRHVALRIARKNGLALVQDGWPMPLMGVDCYVMRVPSSLTIDGAIAQVERDPQVAWSQPMQVYRTQGGAGRDVDPLFAVQPAATLWHLAALHRIATGKGVTVAVVDSKVDVHHPDLAGQFVADRDFVSSQPHAPELHGTGIAGVIAAKADNGIGIAGIAPDARLMALRACWQIGDGQAAPTLCNSLSLAQAIDFAIRHSAKIINLSLSGPSDRLLLQLIGIAQSHGIAVVAAYDPHLPGGGFPASAGGVIAVADESSLASLPAGVYGAPGKDVPTTQPGGKWFLVDGSSYAAAHVSGLIALVREKHDPEPHMLLVASRASGGPIDACATLSGAARPCACACALASKATVPGT